MSRYDTRPHLGCVCTKPGILTFEKDIVENVTVNKRAVKRFNAKAIIKQITKSMFRCDKCSELINVVICPSWEDFVLSGKIRVTKAEYWKIKNDRGKGAMRL